ncbi:hypothetical protein RDABS01_029842 [Bienertia sinuspersici]
MTTFATTTTTISASKTPFLATPNHYRCRKHVLPLLHTKINRLVFPPLRVTNDANKTEVSPDPTVKKSDVDKIMDEMDFGELCNEQLVLDILQLREGNRALGTFAISVNIRIQLEALLDEEVQRPLWITDALENTKVTVQEMVMLSTSVLNIKWTIKGKPESILASISGQVIEHEESWDLSESSPIAQAYFWSSRRLFAAKKRQNLYPKGKHRNLPGPSGDPTKFFQRDDSDQRDLYQIALLLALVYFVVQYLKITL